MELGEVAERVRTRQDLAAFVSELAESLDRRPGDWENSALDRYLRSMSSWIMDMDGFFQWQNEVPPETPTWSLVAKMMLAARVYE